MIELCISNLCSFSPILIWGVLEVIMLIIMIPSSSELKKKAEIIIYFSLITFFISLLYTNAETIPQEYKVYLEHLRVEIGVTLIAVLLIERTYKFVEERIAELNRKFALKSCKEPIHLYCNIWFRVYCPASDKWIVNELNEFNDIESFFKSDKFYEKVCEFKFATELSHKISFDYFYKTTEEVKDKFQRIISTYGSRLSNKDLQLLEHFGSRAYLYNVFRIMKNFKDLGTSVDDTLKLVKKENFQKHFAELIKLINQYNDAVEKESDKWTIDNLHIQSTINRGNEDPNTEW